MRELEAEGWFKMPIFPLPPAIRDSDPSPILEIVEDSAEQIARLMDPASNLVGYDPDNPFFTSPDAEIFYVLVRRHRPGRIVEVGSGHSTRIARQAIVDGELDSEIVSVDPLPRSEVDDLVDRAIRKRLERVEEDIVELLKPGDILFVDSSHEVRAGNDVVRLLLRLIPRLPEGLLIHLHDVFLPYEYPRDWVVLHRRQWSEQYLVQALLMGCPSLKVLWPGHWLQRSQANFEEVFPAAAGRVAKSLWFRNGAWLESA